MKRNLNYITVQLLLRPSATSNFQILVTNLVQFSMLTGVASQGTSVPAVLAHRNPKVTTVLQLNPERASSATDASRKAIGPVSAPATLVLESRIQRATSAGKLGTGDGGVLSDSKGRQRHRSKSGMNLILTSRWCLQKRLKCKDMCNKCQSVNVNLFQATSWRCTRYLATLSQLLGKIELGNKCQIVDVKL